MNTEILIVTYSKDLPYLRLNLETVRKFAKGFSGLTLVVPTEETSDFASIADDAGARLVPYLRNPNSATWHLAAQAQKCWADRHCPNADFVLHTDSDCVFTEPATPDNYFISEKPIMLHESYGRLPVTVPWKPVVEAVLKRSVEFEFMRRHPQVNPVGIYPALRNHIRELHGDGFNRFVESRKPSFPWGFTEHNVIGAFAFYSPGWHGQYHWVEVGKDAISPAKLIQFWSHGPIDSPQELPCGGKENPRAFVAKLLAP